MICLFIDMIKSETKKSPKQKQTAELGKKQFQDKD